MTTAADYANRSFDLLAFSGGESQGDQLLSQTLFSTSSSGEICTGAQKLAQRWMLEFLTIKGSMPFHLAARGSDFMRWLRQGYIRTEFDIQAYFNFAAQQVRINLLNDETTDVPDDERINKANLLSFAITPGFLELQIQVVSIAGDSREVILPISVVPVNIAV